MTVDIKNKGYGYVVVAAAFLMMVVLWGAFYSYGVFFKPLLMEFGWTRATTSGAFSICTITFGLLGTVIGGLNDRFGPRLVMTFCGALMGIAYLLMSRIDALWHLYAFYGLVLGIGMSGSFVPLMTTVARWFERRRSIMTGVIAAGIGIGAMVGPPVVDRLISRYGWRFTYALLGVVVPAVMVLCAQLLRRDPSALKQKKSAGTGATPPPLVADAEGLSLPQALRTKEFWMYAGVIFCFGFCVFSVMVHMVPHAMETGFSSAGAAGILATIGGLSVLGKIVLGQVADRVGNRTIFIYGFAFMAASLLWLTAFDGRLILILFAVVFGVAYGGCVTMESPMVVDLFGLRSHGLILGGIALGFTLGGAIGPWLTGLLFDVKGSYAMGFLACTLLSVVGLVLLLLLKIEKNAG
ncbi:MAG: MFS transporter [Deltaproteobacteria bacterium]|nr:MFS transporter [Deltaproteobacteria bacterium]MBW2283100.1 MFS transporter [Deltaproteobacteria bacterium]